MAQASRQRVPLLLKEMADTRWGSWVQRENTGLWTHLAHPAVPNTARPHVLCSAKPLDMGKQGDSMSLTKVKRIDRESRKRTIVKLACLDANR